MMSSGMLKTNYTILTAMLCVIFACVTMYAESKPAVLIFDNEEDESPQDYLEKLLRALEQKKIENGNEEPNYTLPMNTDNGSVIEAPSKKLCPKGYFTNPFHSCKPSLGRLRGRGRKFRFH